MKRILAALVIFSCAECCAADIKSALQEIREGQKRLDEISQRTGATTYDRVHQVNTTTSRLQFKFYRIDDCFLLEFGDVRVCYSKSQCFQLRKSTPKQQAYNLAKLTSNDKNNSFRKWSDTYLIAQYPLTSFNEMQTVQEFIDDPNVTFDECIALPNNKYQLSYRWSEQFDTETRSSTGKAIFDRNINCVCLESHSVLTFSTGKENLTHDAVRNIEIVNGVITLIKFTETMQRGGKKIRNIENVVLKDGLKNVDPAEFTLEYYSITPPTDDVYEDRGFNWPLWGGLGVGCIVLSLLLAWIVRRRNRLKAGG